MATSHHLLFDRVAWESHPSRLVLRQDPHLIIPMDEEIHSALHKAVPVVPLLDIHTAQHTRKELRTTNSYIGTVYSLMGAIEKGLQHPRTRTLQKQLGELTIHSLEQQVYFIRQGQINYGVYDAK